MNDTKYVIDVHHLSKSFAEKKVVDDVSIQVPRGKIYGFLGPNGSGKTTTIRLICGLLTADAGEGTCLGMNIRTESESIRQRIGYMTQKFSYWEDLTILENIEFTANMYNLSYSKKDIEKLIQELSLTKRQHQLAGNLSGGWKQRLALACCILHQPDLLLLDEPTAGVDPRARREFWNEIHKLASKGLTVLVSTHYMDEAERCHAIIYIADGKIMTCGTVDDVIQKAGLTVWVVNGKSLVTLYKALENHPAISNIAPFGESLHISGTNPDTLSAAINPYKNNPSYHWQLVDTSMEDAFIHYMANAEKENRL